METWCTMSRGFSLGYVDQGRYLVAVKYSARQDGVAGLPTITHRPCSVLIPRSCARRYSLARTISGQRRQRRTQRPRSVEGVHGPWMLSGRSSRCFWHPWPRLNRAQQRHNFFFLLFLTETRHQRTLCGGAPRVWTWKQ